MLTSPTEQKPTASIVTYWPSGYAVVLRGVSVPDVLGDDLDNYGAAVDLLASYVGRSALCVSAALDANGVYRDEECGRSYFIALPGQVRA